MILGALAMLIFALHACTRMVAAGDTWVALASGRHFINHGVSTFEPFSANSHKPGPTPQEVKTWPAWAQWITDKVGLETVRYWHPTGWVNQNWLTHVIFYWLTTLSPFADADSFSFNTLVYWKVAIYIFAVVCVYYTGVVLGINPALSAVFACFSMFIGRTFLDIRPAGFSNLLVAVFLLVLALATYRHIFFIWLIVPLAVFWCNVHGGYIYLFIMLVPFIFIHFVTNFFPKKFVSVGRKGLLHSIAAGFITFLAVIIFNPFHLTNLTHTFVISISKHAELWRTVYEWHPAFEWDNPIGDEIPFLIMYIIAWAALLIWAGALIKISRSIRAYTHKRKGDTSEDYQPPKIDLALMVIASLTIYMAICSRRFIPIGAVAACPVIAMLIDQAVRAISAAYNLHKQNRLTVSPMPQKVQLSFIIAAFIAVSTLGIWWGIEFKRIYLDPWPLHQQFTSVFMRMSASYIKPFYACRFIKDNKLSGKMFNYWTEGGFIAWGQEPDPNTGKTPLKLFMDGRAQAAYEPNVYMTWSDIMAGGPTALNALARGRALTNDDYVKIGRWVDARLKASNIWVVLMPADKFSESFVKGLDRSPDWTPVYFDDWQKLFVDMTTEQGKKLFDGIIKGQTVYPDKSFENLAKAHIVRLYGESKDSKKTGFEFAVESFRLCPSQSAINEIISYAEFPGLHSAVTEFCKNYIDDLEKNKNLYAQKDGFLQRVWIGQKAVNYLSTAAGETKDIKLAQLCLAKYKEYDNDQDILKTWLSW